MKETGGPRVRPRPVVNRPEPKPADPTRLDSTRRHSTRTDPNRADPPPKKLFRFEIVPRRAVERLAVEAHARDDSSRANAARGTRNAEWTTESVGWKGNASTENWTKAERAFTDGRIETRASRIVTERSATVSGERSNLDVLRATAAIECPSKDDKTLRSFERDTGVYREPVPISDTRSLPRVLYIEYIRINTYLDA